MAEYRDPYTDQKSGAYNQRYGDGSAYNPYDSSQPHQSYDQGGYEPRTTGEYKDDPNANPQGAGALYEPEANPRDHPGFEKETG
jgi:hypothetical protein